MGSFASPPTTTTTLSIPISEKLMKTNYLLWRTQVMPALRAAQFEELFTGDDTAPPKQIVVTNNDKTTTNPAYDMWVARDQAVLRYLLSSLTRETLMHVSRCTTATQTWTTLATPYSSQMRTCLVNTRIALATTKKNHLNVSDYYSKMCL
jgi:hypothetical protein